METTATSTLSTTAYAGFGQRLLAYIIDAIVISVLYMVIFVPLIAAIGIGVASEAQNFDANDPAEVGGLVGAAMGAVFMMMLVVYGIVVLYYTLMESSKTQGSLGKMAMGIKVTDMDGNRISFGKAFLRSFGKIISSMIMYVGYLMAAFTEKKQGLHDMTAGTLVVKK